MAKIEDAIKSIPVKKENIRRSFEALRSQFSSVGSFNLQWQDLEAHFSPIITSIEDRFNSLQDKNLTIIDPMTTTTATMSRRKKKKSSTTPEIADGEVPARPELRSLCMNMDAKGLRSYINENRKDFIAIKEELGTAIRCAPDPALLVLDAMDGFYPPDASTSTILDGYGELQINRKISVAILGKLHGIGPKIEPSVREKAKALAVEWRGKILRKGDGSLEMIMFLKLIGFYGLVSEFYLDDVMELFISVSRKKLAIDLITILGFTDKLPDLIQKMISRGRQLEAVKFIKAFNIVDKFPIVPLLEAYISESKKKADEVRKGNNISRAKQKAIAIELGALRSVLKAIEEHELESIYPRENLLKSIAKLEQQKAGKIPEQPPPQQQSRKRPRPSSATPAATSASVSAANSYPPLIQTPPQLAFTDRAPYMGVSGLYSLHASSPNIGPFLSGPVMGHGGAHSPPRAYHTVESLATAGGLYDRPVPYNGYPLSGPPPTYGSSLYP